MAGAALDPERALWIHGEKKIFIPPPRASLHILGVNFDITGNDLTITEDEFQRHYIDPAVKAMAEQLRRYAHYELLPLELPRGLERAETLPQGYRFIQGADVLYDRHLCRVEALVKVRG